MSHFNKWKWIDLEMVYRNSPGSLTRFIFQDSLLTEKCNYAGNCFELTLS